MTVFSPSFVFMWDIIYTSASVYPPPIDKETRDYMCTTIACFFVVFIFSPIDVPVRPQISFFFFFSLPFLKIKNQQLKMKENNTIIVGLFLFAHMPQRIFT